MQRQQDTFEDEPAVRTRVPLLLGLMGPSGGGKTYSALRLATGIREEVGSGDIFVVDTEARRSLHYADKFDFRVLHFGAPFSPLRYLAALQHCAAKGASVIIVDSMSHEHEGPGGVLEMHEAETQRLSALWRKPPSATSFAAWARPKQERRRLINGILQLPVNVVACFRAKQKTKPPKEPGGDLIPQGWMPIAGEEFVYEMGVCGLLMPGANGVPTWQSTEVGERTMIKHPDWARAMLGDRQIDEKMGRDLARWSAGTVKRSAAEVLDAYSKGPDAAQAALLKQEALGIWKSATKDERAALRKADEECKARLDAASKAELEREASEREHAEAETFQDG